MKLLISILFALLLGIFVYAALNRSFNKKQKLISIILSVLLVVLVSIYTILQNKSNRVDFEIIAAFNRGEILKCDGIEISNKEFNLSNGTLSFLGKKDSKYYGKIVSISKCSI